MSASDTPATPCSAEPPRSPVSTSATSSIPRSPPSDAYTLPPEAVLINRSFRELPKQDWAYAVDTRTTKVLTKAIE